MIMALNNPTKVDVPYNQPTNQFLATPLNPPPHIVNMSSDLCTP